MSAAIVMGWKYGDTSLTHHESSMGPLPYLGFSIISLGSWEPMSTIGATSGHHTG